MTQPIRPLEATGAERTGSNRGGRRQQYVLSDFQRRLLLEKYDGHPATIDALMSYFPSVPRWRVKRWATELGLSRQKEPFWTQEEMDFLERHINRLSLKKIAKQLGRTQTAVKLKAKRLHLNKTQDGYTMRGLCLGLGCDHHKIERWIAKGWLKGHRRHSDRTPQQGGDMWYFSDQAVSKFIKEHPEELDPRRFDWLWVVDLLVGLGEIGKAQQGEAS